MATFLMWLELDMMVDRAGTSLRLLLKGHDIQKAFRSDSRQTSEWFDLKGRKHRNSTEVTILISFMT